MMVRDRMVMLLEQGKAYSRDTSYERSREKGIKRRETELVSR